jgi:hypothetical protein
VTQKKKEKEEEKIPKIVEGTFHCNAQGQCTHFAETNVGQISLYCPNSDQAGN